MGWLDELLGIDSGPAAGQPVVINDGPVRAPEDAWHPADREPIAIDDGLEL